MRLLFFALLTSACSGPTKVDDVDDTDAGDTDAADTDLSTETDPPVDTDVDVDPGELIFEDSFESPSLTFGDWTEANLTGWTGERNPVEGPTAGVGVSHLNAGLASVSPLAAPGDGSQVLFLNARDSAWSRATAWVGTMEEGVTYTLTAAVALRTDVATPSSMAVSFYNSLSKGDAVVPETALGTLLDDSVTGQFQSITVRYTAGSGDDGAPLSVRFAAFHTGSSLSQLVVDSVKVYAKAP